MAVTAQAWTKTNVNFDGFILFLPRDATHCHGKSSIRPSVCNVEVSCDCDYSKGNTRNFYRNKGEVRYLKVAFGVQKG